MKIVIFANGHIQDYALIQSKIGTYDEMICCDGGIRHAHAMGLMPNYLLGDCDSINQDMLAFYKNKNVEVIPFPTDKDFTDTELAVQLAIEKKATEVIICGGIGSRLDHTLGNIHVLTQCMDKQVNAMLIDEKNTVQVMNDSISFVNKKGSTISLIPLTTEVLGVKTEGLKYPLCSEPLLLGKSRGISNIIISDEASISIESGVLIVIESMD